MFTSQPGVRPDKPVSYKNDHVDGHGVYRLGYKMATRGQFIVSIYFVIWGMSKSRCMWSGSQNRVPEKTFKMPCHLFLFRSLSQRDQLPLRGHSHAPHPLSNTPFVLCCQAGNFHHLSNPIKLSPARIIKAKAYYLGRSDCVNPLAVANVLAQVRVSQR